MHLEPFKVFLLDQLNNFFIWQVNSEIHVAKDALVVMIVFFLGWHGAKIVECVVINLSHILKTLCQLLLATLHMYVDEGKTCVFKAEPNGDRALVAYKTRKSCHNFYFANLLNFLFVFSFGKHDNVATNHCLLNDRNILRTKSSLDNLFPLKRALFVLAHNYLLCVERHHLLKPNNVYVWKWVLCIVYDMGDLKRVWGWSITSTVPS